MYRKSYRYKTPKARTSTGRRTCLDLVANLEVEHVTRHVSVGVDLDHQVKVALVAKATASNNNDVDGRKEGHSCRYRQAGRVGVGQAPLGTA